MNIKQLITLFILVVSISKAYGQKNTDMGSLTRKETKQSVSYKHSIGASLLMISNFLPDPVDTNFPDDFAAVEEGAPNHIFEPSLNFGFKF